MKLNNTQINALADKFYSEIKEKINKTNEENKIKQLYKFKDNYNKGIKLLKDNPFLNSINIIIAKNTNVNLDRDETFESYVNHYNFNRFIKDKKRSVSIQDVKNDIILATIDAKSVEEIMKTLKLKYK